MKAAQTMTQECFHGVTRTRAGEKGSWCVDCDSKVLEVHDQPCSGCRHYTADGYRVGICRKFFMRVSADMLVTYHLVGGPGRHGLCFEGTTDGETGMPKEG